MFSIGQFSKISGLTIKTLRHYHSIGLLVPRAVDADTRYRYYDRGNLDKARTIAHLRQMMVPLDAIKQILEDYDDDAQVLDFLESHRDQIRERLDELKQASASLDEVISREKEAQAVLAASSREFTVEEKMVDDILIAALRWRGRYDEVGKALVRLMKRVGPLAAGKPFNLYYDEDFKEDGADIETCVPLRRRKAVRDVDVRVLEGGRALTLIHKGPYQQIGDAYARVAEYARERDIQLQPPSREIYLKGPGMIFRGDPKKYLTEIQFMIP